MEAYVKMMQKYEGGACGRQGARIGPNWITIASAHYIAWPSIYVNSHVKSPYHGNRMMIC